MTAVKLVVLIFIASALSNQAIADGIIVDKVYSENVVAYNSEGDFSREIDSKLVLHAKVNNKGETNDMGLLEIALEDGKTVWVQPSHISTNYRAETCRNTTLPTASKDKKAPVNSGVAGNCDD